MNILKYYQKSQMTNIYGSTFFTEILLFFSDFPVALLRNVSHFCKSGGLQGMANAFLLAPEDLPPSLAHALISILCNVKLWLNYRAVPQLFTPVRTNALRYMCELSDAELRQQHPRQIGKIKEIF